MHAIFNSRPLGVADLALLLLVGAALMLLLEVEKHVMRRLGWFKELNGPGDLQARVTDRR